MEGPFYYRRGEAQVGPLKIDEVREHAARGDCGRDDLYWVEGWPEWRLGHTLPELFPPPAVPSGKGQRVVYEIKATARACVEQGRQWYAWGQGRYATWQLEQRATAAQEQLGQKLDATGQADPALHKQLTELAERQENVEAAKGALTQIKAERRGIYLRMAKPWLATEAPAGLENEHRAAVQAVEALNKKLAERSQRGIRLWPNSSQDQGRVAVGFGVVALVVVWLGWIVLSPGPRRVDPLRDLPRASAPRKSDESKDKKSKVKPAVESEKEADKSTKE